MVHYYQYREECYILCLKYLKNSVYLSELAKLFSGSKYLLNISEVKYIVFFR